MNENNFRIALSIPLASSDELKAGGVTQFSRCKMYAVNYTEILMSGVREPLQSWPTTDCQHGWAFNYSNIPYASIAAEVNFKSMYNLYQKKTLEKFYFTLDQIVRNKNVYS